MWKTWIKAQKKMTAGTTLVELITTFALIGIFMAAASLMLASSLRMFTRMQATANAVTVSDLLLDKIAGEITAARAPDKNGQGYYFWLEKNDGSPWVVMQNRTGSPIAILAVPTADGGNELCIRYYETVKGSAYESENVRKVPEMDWHFDKNVYMGYRITDGGLKFSYKDPEGNGTYGTHPNVVRIDMEIEHIKTHFKFKAARYAESYNYDFDLEKVKKYMGVTRAENLAEGELPGKAVDFMIKKEEPGPPGPGPGPDKGGPVTVTDSTGRKHTLYPNESWEEIKKDAREHYGHQLKNVTMLSDSSGFYIFINAQHVGADVGDKTLAEFAKGNNNFKRITEDTKIFVAEDLVDSNGKKKWPYDNYPKAGDLAYINGAYYIAQGDNEYDIPPIGVWVALPIE